MRRYCVIYLNLNQTYYYRTTEYIKRYQTASLTWYMFWWDPICNQSTAKLDAIIYPLSNQPWSMLNEVTIEVKTGRYYLLSCFVSLHCVPYGYHMATYIWANIGPGKGLLPDAIKPWRETMLTNHHTVFWPWPDGKCIGNTQHISTWYVFGKR